MLGLTTLNTLHPKIHKKIFKKKPKNDNVDRIGTHQKFLVGWFGCAFLMMTTMMKKKNTNERLKKKRRRKTEKFSNSFREANFETGVFRVV